MIAEERNLRIPLRNSVGVHSIVSGYYTGRAFLPPCFTGTTATRNAMNFPMGQHQFESQTPKQGVLQKTFILSSCCSSTLTLQEHKVQPSLGTGLKRRCRYVAKTHDGRASRSSTFCTIGFGRKLANICALAIGAISLMSELET